MQNKISLLLLCFLSVSVFFPACNKTESPMLLSSIGTVEADNLVFLDFDTTYIHFAEGLPLGYKPNDRVSLFFNILKTMPSDSPYAFEAQLVNINRISTLNTTLITDTPADTTYKDPIVDLTRMWLSRNFLTVDFTSYILNPALHSFKLSKRESENKPNADSIWINFRHDAGGDEKGSLNRMLLSFDLTALKPLKHDTVVLVVRTLINKTDTINTTTTKYFNIIKENF